MFKRIPGNNFYKISLTGKILTNTGCDCSLPIINNKVNIFLYDRERSVDIYWLALIAHFEINLPNEHIDEIWDINFKDTYCKCLRTVTSKIVTFKRPIYVYDEFRIIPGYSLYAVNKEGIVIRISINRPIKILTNGDDYSEVNIYDPDNTVMRDIKLHRLVALAWCDNDDFITKPIVNHKNGIKTDIYYSNLEWCSYSENSEHAFNSKLRHDTIACKILDIVTKEITEFTSISQACKFMGLDRYLRLSELIGCKKGKLISERYEVKSIDDDTPWFYEINEIGTKTGRYSLKVTMPDNSFREYHDIRTFKKIFQIHNVNNINDILTKAENKYPGMKIDYVDNYAISLKRTKTSVLKFKPKQITAKSIDTGEEKIFSSLREAAKYFDIDRSVITTRLGTNKDFCNWLFR